MKIPGAQGISGIAQSLRFPSRKPEALPFSKSFFVYSCAILWQLFISIAFSTASYCFFCAAAPDCSKGWGIAILQLIDPADHQRPQGKCQYNARQGIGDGLAAGKPLGPEEAGDGEYQRNQEQKLPGKSWAGASARTILHFSISVSFSASLSSCFPHSVHFAVCTICLRMKNEAGIYTSSS